MLSSSSDSDDGQIESDDLITTDEEEEEDEEDFHLDSSDGESNDSDLLNSSDSSSSPVMVSRRRKMIGNSTRSQTKDSKREVSLVDVLYDSIKKGDFKTVKDLVPRLSDVNKTWNCHWKDPELKNYKYRFLNLLFYSVYFDRLEITKFFVEQCGMDVYQIHVMSNENLLHLSVKRKNCSEFILYLLSKGVSRSLRNKDGKTPEELTTDEDTRFLIKEYTNIKPLIPMLNMSKRKLLTYFVKSQEKIRSSETEISKLQEEVLTLRRETTELKKQVQDHSSRKIGWADIRQVLPQILHEENLFHHDSSSDPKINEENEGESSSSGESSTEEEESVSEEEEDGNLDDSEILTLQTIRKKVEDLESQLTRISPSSEGGLEGWVSHVEQFSDTTDLLKVDLSEKIDFLERNEELSRLELYFHSLQKYKPKIVRGIKKYQLHLKNISNYSQECLSQSSLLYRAFLKYRDLLSQTKQEGKDLKRMKFHLELNEEYLTEQEEQRIQKKIQYRNKAYQEHKRELERLQKYICQPFPTFKTTKNGKTKFVDLFKSMKTHLLCGIRDTKKRYIELLNQLNVLHSSRRRRSLIDVFVNLNLFLFHRTLKDYTNLTLLYLNNENRIYKGSLQAYDEVNQRMRDKPVVIKCLPYTPRTEKVVQNEVLNLLDLMSHPAVISINCVFQFKDTYTKREYLALEMDYMDYDLLHWLKDVPFQPKESINDVMKLPSKRKATEVKSIFRQILQAISYIHMKGIIHADLKFQNILVLNRPPSPKVKIIDFGVSKNSNSSFFTTLGAEQRHTFRYKPPEGKVTKAYDIFSLGRMLFEAVCPPHLVDSVILTEEKVIFPKHKDLPKDAMDLVSQMMNICPFRRISANEVLEHEYFGYGEIETLKGQVLDPQTKMELVVSHLNEIRDTALVMRPNPITFLVNREDENLVDVVLEVIGKCKTLRELLTPFDVRMSNRFEKETGIDQGGVTNELYALFSERVIRVLESSGEEDEGGVVLPTDSLVEIQMFKNFGRYVLRILLSRDNTLNIRFGKFLYNFLLFKEPKTLPQLMENCEDFDPVFAKNIKKLVLESPEEELSGFTFRTREGKEEVLNSSNTLEFMWYKLKKKLYGENGVRFGNLQAMRTGFYEFLSEKTRKIIQSLSSEEFENFLCGEKRDLTFVKVLGQIRFDSLVWKATDQLMQTRLWMERYLREGCSNLKRFVYYCTALTNLPAHEDLQKKIKMLPNSNRFYAHTCQRSMDVKTSCESYDQLKNELDQILGSMEMAGLYEFE